MGKKTASQKCALEVGARTAPIIKAIAALECPMPTTKTEMPSFEIVAKIVDIPKQRIVPARVKVTAGRIEEILAVAEEPTTFLLPGFIDSHVHIESSMLLPSEFARAAVVHGTVATVSDPHEIANVLGAEGVRYMLDAADGIPFKFHFGAPSCVPATPFETAGATLKAVEVAALLDDPRIGYLSEVMNFPGVLSGDREVLAKIEAAHTRGKPVDGHAPGLRGEEARNYIAAGISTDHECFTRGEALDKLAAGAKILIREGSAARNFEALHTLIDEYPDRCMFCSDDKHPDELLHGHINQLVKRAVENGVDCMKVLQAACINPIEHYQLDVGMLRVGDPADFIELDDLSTWKVLRTFIAGRLVADQGKPLFESKQLAPVNRFAASTLSTEMFQVPVPAKATDIHVIEVIDGELMTLKTTATVKNVDGFANSDPENDILKIAVVNRYQKAMPAIAFAKNFGLRRGAIASSVAHDSHNVIAVGTSDQQLCEAVNLVIEAGGGLSLVADNEHHLLPLPIAGLMSNESCQQVGDRYAELDKMVKALGCPLRAPYMALSFMALLVIPEIKLSDRGLFDATRFEFMPLFKENPDTQSCPSDTSSIKLDRNE